MRLATVRTAGGATRAVRVAGDTLLDLGAADVGELLARPDWPERAARAAEPVTGHAGYAPVVPRPGKIVCVGLNYRTHILEMGRELPRHPTLFAKYPRRWSARTTRSGSPPESGQVDWEAELAGGVRPSLTLSAWVDGELVQRADTADLVFDPVDLVRYVSTILTLNPGDVIATGTPGGVGHAREPARYLADGSVLATEITGLGRSEVKAVAERAA
ncbi:fumarylacetoacetate hydrolase family protein [Actinomadura sp. ATCC 31491]|uniref:Fumarylacetoacetate hydrolase family protein n=1 Tax=Actinomadura luzonensis TaxID=2805427 RepID=A0ABT0FXA5_9ACTN|nr:fumarylacetoacetate hydrolase family protein [Actinomadura luzonensis]MCK2216983.1 fumarylacetoacetate hydrolase family protein [Actinomadura luzonensis]